MKLHDLGHLGYYNEKLRNADAIIKQIHIGEQEFCKSDKALVVNYLNPNPFSEVISLLGFSISFRVFLNEFRWTIDKFISTSFFDDDLREYVDLYFDNIVSTLQAKIDELGANEEQLFMAKFFDKALVSELISNIELEDMSDFVSDLALNYLSISTLSFGKSKSSLCYKGVSTFYTKELVRLVEYQRLEINNHFFSEQRPNELHIEKRGKELLLNEFSTYVDESITDLDALINQKQMVSKIKVRLKKGILIEFFKRMKYNGYIKCSSNRELAVFLSENFQYNSGVKFLDIDVFSTKKSYLDRFDKEPEFEKRILNDKVGYISPTDRVRILM